MFTEFDIIVFPEKLTISRRKETDFPIKILNIYIYKNGKEKVKIKGIKYKKFRFANFLFIRSIYDIDIRYKSLTISREGNVIMIKNKEEKVIIGLNEINKKMIEI